MKKVWLLGDDFLASTVRIHFKKSSHDFFLKENYQVDVFCGNRFNNSNQNVLSRIQISLASAINSVHRLHNFILMILDNDLIEFLKFKEPGAATMYGTWIEWLCNTLQTMVKDFYLKLPKKARNDELTQFYWVTAANHGAFDFVDRKARDKFNLCVESVVKGFDNMRTIKIKEKWCFDDTNLVVNNRFTNAGFAHYWQAIDASFEYNVAKRRDFLICANFRTLMEQKEKEAETGDKRNVISARLGARVKEYPGKRKVSRDPDMVQGGEQSDQSMKKFFKRSRMVDRYHWHKNSRVLPEPPAKK